MSPIEALLHLFDDTRSHPFESLASALDGVDAALAARQPAAYASEPREEGWPPPGSIAWQVAHVAHCKAHYADRLRAVGADAAPNVRPWTACEDWTALRARLDAAHAEQREALAALAPDDLERRIGTGMTAVEFVAMMLRHDAWHASQIVIARRLLAAGSPDGPDSASPSA